jgi:tRNA (guanine37-N1)-methyltransferase
MMRVQFATLFPETVLCAVRYSILARAEAKELVTFSAVDPREFATDAHKSVDDEPYGGGPGMVMKPNVWAAALDSIKTEPCAIVFPDPNGKMFRQSDALELSAQNHLIFVCGHYEGFDERFVDTYATHRFSLGDFIVTGGELAAALMADAIVRLIPGAVKEESKDQDAFSDGLLTNPQYTRPEVWRGVRVPAELLSGDHAKIRNWRRAWRLRATRERRPDLFSRAPLTSEDLDLLK